MSAQVRVLNLADVVPDDLAEDIEWTIGDEVKNSVHALIAEHAQGAIKLAAISARRDEKRLSNEREARHASKPTTTDYRTRIDAALHVGLAVLNIPKPDELVEGWLDRRSLAIVYGPSGSGKSFIALDVAMRVATGDTWQSKQCNAGTVLYIVAEGSGDIAARVDAWLSQYDEPRPIQAITFLTIPINLLNVEEVDALVSLARRDEYALIVIDTLARSMVGGDESTSKDGGLVIEACDRLRDASGACIVLVHHTGYDQSHMRGTTSLFGAADTVIEVKKSDDLVIVTAKKQKSRADDEKLFLKLTPRHDSLVVETAHGTGRVGNTGRTALQALVDADSDQGMTTKEWMAVARMTDFGNFATMRTDLVRRSLVVPAGKGRGARYRISDSGRALLAGGMA